MSFRKNVHVYKCVKSYITKATLQKSYYFLSSFRLFRGHTWTPGEIPFICSSTICSSIMIIMKLCHLALLWLSLSLSLSLTHTHNPSISDIVHCWPPVSMYMSDEKTLPLLLQHAFFILLCWFVRLELCGRTAVALRGAASRNFSRFSSKPFVQLVHLYSSTDTATTWNYFIFIRMIRFP